jgi:hypothetical protein
VLVAQAVCKDPENHGILMRAGARKALIAQAPLVCMHIRLFRHEQNQLQIWIRQQGKAAKHQVTRNGKGTLPEIEKWE